MPNVEDQPSLIQIVYASAANVHFSSEDLETLLERARANNEPRGLTGVLLYKDETFFQVLEGEPEHVHSLYSKIELDPRHSNVLLLVQREISERNFGEWSMGFLRDHQTVEQLPGFVDFFGGQSGANFIDLYGDKQRISQILDGFRRGRWRRQAVKQIA